jgi:hypothetical protein
MTAQKTAANQDTIRSSKVPVPLDAAEIDNPKIRIWRPVSEQ